MRSINFLLTYLFTDRQTDGRATAYIEREREFTFAKNRVPGTVKRKKGPNTVV